MRLTQALQTGVPHVLDSGPYNAELWLGNRLWADETGVCHCGTITVLSLVVTTTTKSWLVNVGLPRILRGARSHHIAAGGLQTSLLHLTHPPTSERTQKMSLSNTNLWTESVRTATGDPQSGCSTSLSRQGVSLSEQLLPRTIQLCNYNYHINRPCTKNPQSCRMGIEL